MTIAGKFEVASHQWIDLTDKSGQFGTTILTDCKNGSDKPDDNTLRLTLDLSPGVRAQYNLPGQQRLGAITNSCTASRRTRRHAAS